MARSISDRSSVGDESGWNSLGGAKVGGELPAWIVVSSDTQTDDPDLLALDPGECAAIALAIRLQSGLLLLDERDGRAVAARKGIAISGTVGVLRDGAKRRLIDFDEEVVKLRHLGFRVSDDVIDEARRGLAR